MKKRRPYKYHHKPENNSNSAPSKIMYGDTLQYTE